MTIGKKKRKNKQESKTYFNWSGNVRTGYSIYRRCFFTTIFIYSESLNTRKKKKTDREREKDDKKVLFLLHFIKLPHKIKKLISIYI